MLKRKELLEQETMMIKNDSISKSGNTGNSGCGKVENRYFIYYKDQSGIAIFYTS